MEAPIFNVKSPKGMAAVLMISTFVGLFGETALNMALTNIMDDFGVSAASAAWLTTGYLLVLAVLVPLSSYLVRQVYNTSVSSGSRCIRSNRFVIRRISTELCGIIGRSFRTSTRYRDYSTVNVQCCNADFPGAKAWCRHGDRRDYFNGRSGIRPVNRRFDRLFIKIWRYIFWIMVVVYAVVIVLALSKVDNVSNVTRPKIDLLSLIASTFGFGGVVFALATLAEQSITKPIVWVPLVVGFVLLVVFGIRQTKMDEPMIDLSVFKSPMFSLGVALMVATMFMILSVAILVPMFLKTVLGFAALTAGLCMLPGNILNIIMSPIVGTNFDKVGAKIFTRIGFTLILVSMIVFLTTISATTATWIIIVNLCVFFVGVSMTIMPAQTNAMNSLAPHKFADGSAALNTLTQIAGASGTAVAITMFTIGQQNYIEKFSNALPAEFLAHGVHSAFIVVTVVAVLGLVGSFFVKNSKPVGN